MSKLNFSFEALIGTIPDHGVWSIERTQAQELDRKYLASWARVNKGGMGSILAYSDTPKQALINLVAQIKGPLLEAPADE